jgi:hypothetical protein
MSKVAQEREDAEPPKPLIDETTTQEEAKQLLAEAKRIDDLFQSFAPLLILR